MRHTRTIIPALNLIILATRLLSRETTTWCCHKNKNRTREESTMTTPPPTARSHNNNLNKERHCHCNKRYTLICFLLSCPLLIVLATSTPTSSLEFQCASFLPAFNDSIHFNPSAILDKIKPESTSAMRAWTCHGRTHKEMVEKLKSVSRRTK